MIAKYIPLTIFSKTPYKQRNSAAKKYLYEINLDSPGRDNLEFKLC